MIKLHAKISTSILLSCFVSIAAVLPASALGNPHRVFSLTPSIYDPGSTGAASSSFVNMDGLTVLRLALSSNVPYPPGIAAQATISGPVKVIPLTTFAPNLTLNTIAFDITSDSQNAGGAPRFNIFDNNGNYWLMTCLECKQAGTSTLLPNGQGKPYTWSRVTCNPANIPELSNGAHPGLPFTNSTIVTRLEIVFDYTVTNGPAFANLANVSLNGDIVAPNLVPTVSH